MAFLRWNQPGDFSEDFPGEITHGTHFPRELFACASMYETPNTAACNGSAPRAQSPARIPASTSPEPAVAKPTLPAVLRYAGPSGEQINVSDPFKRTMLPNL